MAIGARILSDNLSGKTATVTFTPVTGTTSGDTQNLGEKTIPFNNITSHPYGYYNLNVIEYDYTYTLFIEEPITEKELFVLVSQIIDSNNYGVVTMNATDFTAEIIDFGIDATYWAINNIYPSTELGFMYEFEGRGDYQEKYVIFTDSSNQVIGTYSATTSNRDMDTLEGRWLSYEDISNGVLKVSNGTVVLTLEWDPSLYYVDIEWDWDATNKEKSIVIGKHTLDNNETTYYLGKQDGTLTEFYALAESGYTVNFKLQAETTFMVGVIYDEVNQYYQEFDIRDENGGIIGDSYVLDGASYNNMNYYFYGNNKIVLIFWDGNNTTVDYKIYHFDGNTNTMTIDYHNREFFDNFSVNSNSIFWPDDNISDNIVMIFYQYNGWNNIGTVTSNCDIVYMLSGDSGFTTYNYANTSKSISPWGYITDDGWYTVGTDESGYLNLISLNSTNGITLTNTNLLITDVNYWNYDSVENNFYSSIFTTTGDVYFGYYNSSGVLLDNLFYSGSPSVDYYTTRGTLYLKVNQDSFYINNTTTEFTTINSYPNIYYPNWYFSNTFLDPNQLFLYDPNTRYGRFLMADSIGTEFLLPENQDYRIEIGKDKLLFVYQQVETSLIIINLYDFNGNLLNSYDTEFTSWIYVEALKDRYIVTFQNSPIRTVIMINEDSVLIEQITDLDNYDSINDIVWWD